MRPRAEALATASVLDPAPSLPYTAWACVFTVLVDTCSRSPISRKERWLGRNRKIRSSAIVSEAAPESADA